MTATTMQEVDAVETFGFNLFILVSLFTVLQGLNKRPLWLWQWPAAA